MMKKLIAAFFAGWLAFAPAQAANQASVSVFTSGPHSAADFAINSLNPALLAIFTCNWGPSAPANGPGGVPASYQCWADTTANPVVFKRYDGTTWVSFGKLNTTTHAWTVFGADMTLTAPNGHAIGATSPGTGWGLYHGGTLTASAGFAINWQTDAILTAGNNNDILQAMRISASINRAGKTGVEADGLYIGPNSGGPFDFGIKIVDTSPLSMLGRIGVGFNTAPVAKIQINNNTATAVNRLGVLPDVMITAADSAPANVYMQPVAQSGGLQSLRYNGTYASPTTLVANDQMLAVGAGGWDGTAETPNGAFMAVHAAQTWGATVHGAYIRWATTAVGANAFTETMRLQPSGGLSVGNGVITTDYGAGSIGASGSIASGTPVSSASTTRTIGATESSSIFTASTPVTVTLPAASSFPGRWWYAKITGGGTGTVTSASANIVPLSGGAAVTTLFPTATAGSWKMLQSDGTNWVIMAGG